MTLRSDYAQAQQSIRELNKLAVQTIDNPEKLIKIDAMRVKEMAAMMGLSPDAASQFLYRESINLRYWPMIIETMAELGYKITADDLLPMQRVRWWEGGIK